MAVAVEVVYHELRVVGAGTDVKAEVDTPELCAVELIAVDDAGGRAAAVGVVLAVRRIPLDEKLVLAVAIDITH